MAIKYTDTQQGPKMPPPIAAPAKAKPANDVDAPRKRFDRTAYQRELMRKRRAAARAKPA